MSEDKPLHVRVAEALGCSPRFDGVVWCCTCRAGEHVGSEQYNTLSTSELNYYDTDWSATGPLIEKYQIGFYPAGLGTWAAEWRDGRYENGIGDSYSKAEDTPLLAVCNLILALKEAGKL